jgi:hypothetical protein
MIVSPFALVVWDVLAYNVAELRDVQDGMCEQVMTAASLEILVNCCQQELPGVFVPG